MLQAQVTSRGRSNFGNTACWAAERELNPFIFIYELSTRIDVEKKKSKTTTVENSD